MYSMEALFRVSVQAQWCLIKYEACVVCSSLSNNVVSIRYEICHTLWWSWTGTVITINLLLPEDEIYSKCAQVSNMLSMMRGKQRKKVACYKQLVNSLKEDSQSSEWHNKNHVLQFTWHQFMHGYGFIGGMSQWMYQGYRVDGWVCLLV